MREAIGGTWIFQVVIGFIFLFTAFICLSVNRSKAFAVKDQIVQVIQSYNGISDESMVNGFDGSKIDAFYDIVDYIKTNSFRNTGVAPADEEDISYTCYDRNGKLSTSDKNVTFCIAKVSVRDKISTEYSELPSMNYYKVVVFYQLDIPIFHDLFNFKITGTTKTMLGEAIA